MQTVERCFLFDDFLVDRHGRCIQTADGAPVPLTGRAFDVLVYLADHADRVVGKDELLSQIWSGRVIEENNLAQAVSAVRRALRASGATTDCIVTVPGRGYRFTPNVLPAVDGEHRPAPRAHKAYLAGRYLIHMPSPESLHRAIAYFRQALYIDPGMSRAWAGKAFAWRTLPMVADVDPREAFPLASAAVDRALEIASDLAEAHSSRAFIHFWYDWDWARAEAGFQQAIARDPKLAEARLGYAHLLNNLRRFDEAICQVHCARELDPLSPIIAALEAGFLQWAGRSEEAAARVERALTLAPEFWVTLVMRGTIALESGAAARAVVDFERAGELSAGSTQALSLLGIAYVQAGRRADAEALLAQFEARARSSYVPSTAIATLRNALGDVDGALEALQHALTQRDLRLTFLQVDRRWDNLRSLPAFADLIQTLRLP